MQLFGVNKLLNLRNRRKNLKNKHQIQLQRVDFFSKVHYRNNIKEAKINATTDNFMLAWKIFFY
jgi:hypothetical protein